METKKKLSADIRQYRGIFFNIGLIVAICSSLAAFEWKTFGEYNTLSRGIVIDQFPEEVPITIIDPPPPPPKPIKLIEIKEEEEDLTNIELPNIETEITDLTKISKYEIKEPPVETTEVDSFWIVEQMPSFKGGLQAFYKYIGKKVKYPSTARRLRIEGKVFVTFIIDKNGKVTNVQVLRGIGGGCDEEAIRVIEKSPKWNPGKQRGKPVKVTMTLPITFKLN